MNAAYVFIGTPPPNSRTGGRSVPSEVTETVTSEIITSLPDYVELVAGGDPVEILVYGFNLSSAPTYGDAELDDAAAQIITPTLITLSVEASAAAAPGSYSLTLAGQTRENFFRVSAAPAAPAEFLWAWNGSSVREFEIATGDETQAFAVTGTGPGPLLSPAAGTVLALSSTHLSEIIAGVETEYALSGLTPNRSAVIAGSKIVYPIGGGSSQTLRVTVCDHDGSNASNVTVSATSAAYFSQGRCRWDGVKVWGTSFINSTNSARLWWLNPLTSAFDSDLESTYQVISIDVDATHVWGYAKSAGSGLVITKHLKADFSLVSATDLAVAVGGAPSSGHVILDGTTLYAVIGRFSDSIVLRIDTSDMSYDSQTISFTGPSDLVQDDFNVYVASHGTNKFAVISKETLGVTVVTADATGGLFTPTLAI
jgi:hypothetical protein